MYSNTSNDQQKNKKTNYEELIQNTYLMTFSNSRPDPRRILFIIREIEESSNYPISLAPWRNL